MSDLTNLNSLNKQLRFFCFSICLLVFSSLLTGCAAMGLAKPRKNSGQNGEAPANESLLKAADNHAGLIELYKSRLALAKTDQEQQQARLQLGKTYLAINDPESTLFFIDPLLTDGQGDAEIWLLQSQALLALDKPQEAMNAVRTAKQKSSSNPAILNQIGLVHANQGNYSAAREAITQARNQMLDDRVVKNNLAMLDILEQDYSSAIKRLMPLYTSGQADERIKANLVLALVRAGLYNEFKSVYAGAKTDQERQALFIVLSSASLEEARH